MIDVLAHLIQAHGMSAPLSVLEALELAGSLLAPLDALGALIEGALEFPLIASLVAPAALAFRVLTALLMTVLALALFLLSQLASVGAADLAAFAHAVGRLVQLGTLTGGR